MQSDDEILERIRGTLMQLFQLDAADVTPEARLYEDLEIDSIDVVDLMDEVQRHTGRRSPRKTSVPCARSATWSRSCSACCMRENG